jgi:small-conductance mechanosensitive channel
MRDGVKPWTRRISYATFAYVLIGAGLLIQPNRFSRTPAYGNLIRVFPAQTWGVIYLVIAAGLALWVLGRVPAWWGIAIHTVAITLVSGWLLAFVVRWITDDSTTIVNVASWSIFLLLTIRSSIDAYDDLDEANDR